MDPSTRCWIAIVLCGVWMIVFAMLSLCPYRSYSSYSPYEQEPYSSFCEEFFKKKGQGLKGDRKKFCMTYMLIGTVMNAIIGILLFFFYLRPYRKTGVRDTTTLKSMHYIIQAWRGLSFLNLFIYVNYYLVPEHTIFDVSKKSYEKTDTEDNVETLLLYVLLAIFILSLYDYSVPVAASLTLPIALPSSPVTPVVVRMTQVQTYPTATPTY